MSARVSATMAVAAVAMTAAGCGPSPLQDHVSRPVALDLQSPAGDDAAVLFTIGGGPIDSVTAEGYRVFVVERGPDSAGVIVEGELTSGSLAMLWVPEGVRVTRYRMVVEQAVARRTFAQRDTRSYTVRVADR